MFSPASTSSSSSSSCVDSIREEIQTLLSRYDPPRRHNNNTHALSSPISSSLPFASSRLVDEISFREEDDSMLISFCLPDWKDDNSEDIRLTYRIFGCLSPRERFAMGGTGEENIKLPFSVETIVSRLRKLVENATVSLTEIVSFLVQEHTFLEGMIRKMRRAPLRREGGDEKDGDVGKAMSLPMSPCSQNLSSQEEVQRSASETDDDEEKGQSEDDCEEEEEPSEDLVYAESSEDPSTSPGVLTDSSFVDDLREAQNLFGKRIQYHSSRVHFLLDLSFLDWKMIAALNLSEEQLVVTIRFPPSYVNDVAAPIKCTCVSQHNNDVTSLEFQVSLIVDTYLERKWPYRNRKENSNPLSDDIGFSMITSNSNLVKLFASHLDRIRDEPPQSPGIWKMFMNHSLGLSNPFEPSSCNLSEDFPPFFFDESLLNSPNIIVSLFSYLHIRFFNLTSFCCVCDKAHSIDTLKAIACSNPLCQMTMSDFCRGVSLVHEIRKNSEVIDLLICMLASACLSKNNEKRRNYIIEPFPLDFLDGHDRNYEDLLHSLETLPRIDSLKAFDAQEDLMSCIGFRSYRLLCWLLTTLRSNLFKLPEEQRIPLLPESQFVMLSTPPEKEAVFLENKRMFGSFFAFHGSPFYNWLNILRHGLKNASNTEYQLHGAVHGPGIYLSLSLPISLRYSPPFHGWKSSNFGNTTRCFAICEGSKSFHS